MVFAIEYCRERLIVDHYIVKAKCHHIVKEKRFVFDHRRAKITIADRDVGHWLNIVFGWVAVVAFFQWPQYQNGSIAGIFTLSCFHIANFDVRYFHVGHRGWTCSNAIVDRSIVTVNGDYCASAGGH